MARRQRGGFALLITLTLLAFLVLLLVGLATFTKVETQISDNTAKQAQARRNALMALNIALGQLQKYAGPDTRVTATAEAFGGIDGTKHYTGVWNSATPGTTAMTWLVSGSENGTVNPAQTPASAQELVGAGTSVGANDVVAGKVPIQSDNVPGQSGIVTVGNYAWWVGDEGVKASVGLSDRGEFVNYAPWDTPTQSRRIRQQIAATPSYFRNIVGTQYGFDPFSIASTANLVGSSQLQLLTPTYTPAPVTSFFRAHFHDLAWAAYGVLANTRADAYRGLQRDLSLKPTELGDAFAAYANYPGYMESPTSGASAVPAITTSDSPRRRYTLTPPITRPSAPDLPNLIFSVAPVLTDFLLQFKFNRTATNTVTVSSRLYVALWNPYTAALVPPAGLALEITGLPQVTVSSSTGSGTFDLASNLPLAVASSGTLRVSLPFTTTTAADRASWLPGRQYAWVTPTGAGASGTMTFYNKNLNATGWDYTTTATVPGTASNNSLGVSGPAVSGLIVTLKSGTTTLATYQAPNYAAISEPLNTFSWKFAFGFRLTQPNTGDTDRSWLQAFDPRGDLATPALDSFDPNEQPGSNPNFFNTSGAPVTAQYLNAFLLFRSLSTGVSSLSAMNDVPIFELPRMPLLSVGELQHLRVEGERPFAIGNPWGRTANAIFDRFFFSGLPTSGAHPDLSLEEPLPNWNLRVVDTRANTSSPWSIAIVRENDNAASALYSLSSRFLLQGGAFNVNSTSQAAWRAVLSGLRFPSSAPFIRAVLDSNTGGQVATAPVTNNELFDQDSTLGSGLSSVAFLRFPQSAQETYMWLPDAIYHAQVMSTQAFRMGVRAENLSVADTTLTQQLHSLTVAQIELLATAIANLVVVKATASGPFRTMEEFLSPNVLFNGKSLLEKAIEDAALNPAALTFDVADPLEPGFGSLTLTQADIMTALAPYLRTRSDTVLVRAYGDVVNPVTTAMESTAYLEATVQRLPATVDATDNIAQPLTSGFGRRYRIVSLRWLSSSDI